jgi:ketosteroid isomerase-like protein
MSQNADAVRVMAEALRSREALEQLASGDVDLGLFDHEIEWDMSAMAGVMPADTVAIYRGHEGMLTYWRQWLEAWRDLQYEVQDVHEAGDAVLVLVRNSRFWGRHSGIVTELPPFGMVFTFRDGRVVRLRSFPDHESALKAVGLSE